MAKWTKTIDKQKDELKNKMFTLNFSLFEKKNNNIGIYIYICILFYKTNLPFALLVRHRTKT